MNFVPLRARAQRDGHVLCTSDGGSFFRASIGMAARLATDHLSDNDADFLYSRGLLIDEPQGLAWEALAHNVARRLTLAQSLDYLILVPTLRCNLACEYCQVSRVDEARKGFDWSEETLSGVLRLIDGLETPSVKIEFQGGEPTLRPDLIKAVMDRCERFDRAQFVICTNLQRINEEVLEIFDRDDVFISTSLDGDPQVHQSHRTVTGERTTEFWENLERLSRRYPGKISALPTIDPLNPPDPDSLIDAFLAFGFNNIFLRPINYQGFARKRFKESVRTSDEWRVYYESFVRNLIARNWNDQSRVLQETYLSICLRRIFQPGVDRHVDLRNPNPMGVDYLVIDHDGRFYPTDEARMLARSGVIDLSIGDVASGIDSAKRRTLNQAATNFFDPDCRACAFQPYCGRDIVDDLARYGRIDVARGDTEFCRRHKSIFDFIFELIYEEDPAVQSSLRQWLGVDGQIALGETWA